VSQILTLATMIQLSALAMEASKFLATPVEIKPSERAFDRPAPWQDLETICIGGALDDRQCPAT
jgi:hypothetical protein